MADFLTRLVGRTIGLAPTVQPIIAPMYAPTPGIQGERSVQMGFGSEITGDVDGMRQAPFPTTEGPERVFSEREHNPEASFVDDLHHQGLQEHLPSIISPQHEHLQIIAHPQTTPANYTTVEQDKAVEVGQPQGIPLRPDLRNKVPDHFARSLIEDTSPQVEPDIARTRLERRLVGDHLVGVEGHQQNLYAERLQSSGITEVSPSTPGSAMPVRAARSQGPMALAHNGPQAINQRETVPEPATVAPTVQVTIGRIEVRAAPPATSRAQAQRATPPTMSLDDYLNSRAKGGH